MMLYKYDVHGKRLWEAELDIPAKLEEAYLIGYDTVMIIHGYRRGFVLGHYIRNRLMRDIRRFTPIDVTLVQIEPKGLGCTIIKFMRNN